MDVIICGLKEIPSIKGGVERGAEELSVRLVAKGYKVTICCQGFKGIRRYRRFVVIGVGKFLGKYSSYFFSMACAFFVIVFKFNKGNAIIHLHSPCVNGIWVPLLKCFGFDVIVHTHGLEWKALKWPFWFKYFMKFFDFIGRFFSNVVICVSDGERNWYEKSVIYRYTPLYKISNGSPNCDPYEKTNILNTLLLNHKDYYLFIGRLVPQKCVLDLIQAYKISKSKKKLLIVGESSASDNYVSKLRTL